MKILYFDDFRLGVLNKDGAVVDVSALVEDIPHTGPHDLINGLIERFDNYSAKLRQATENGKGIPLASLRVRPPLPRRPHSGSHRTRCYTPRSGRVRRPRGPWSGPRGTRFRTTDR